MGPKRELSPRWSGCSSVVSSSHFFMGTSKLGVVAVPGKEENVEKAEMRG
jgi:hypothetical protein